MILSLLGGIGLFLLGMVLMTDGLKAAAGDSLRRTLQRATSSQTSAILHGAGLTALVQSSSATTLATIGFVSAGVLTFQQALGVIFGATVGTTSTGWIVSLLGLKLSIGTFALPIVGIGALTRLLGRGPVQSIGLAIAGFGLIFVGIDVLQKAMATLSEHFDPADFPTGSTIGSIGLVIVGVVMTVVMQSSSAAVATTMTALHGGALTFEQAAPLVIGQSIGTTVTSGIASLGASIAARRTALAHILFSVITGTLAFLLLPIVYMLVNASMTDGASPSPIALAVFHTSFNVLGVLIFLPFTARFARLVMRILPEPERKLARNLDRSMVGMSSVAVDAARRTAIETAAVVFESIELLIRTGSRSRLIIENLQEAEHAMEETRQFLGEVRTEPASRAVYDRHVATLHAVDHLTRLVEACAESAPLRTVVSDEDMRNMAIQLCDDLKAPLRWLRGSEAEAPVELMQKRSHLIADNRKQTRPRILERTAAGELDPDRAMRLLEASRWLDRLAYHIWRAANYLQDAPRPDDHGSTVEDLPSPAAAPSS